MSVKQMAKVWDCSPLKAEQLLIHLALADHMDHDGVGWVSWPQIQSKARVGRSTVARTLRWLQEHGWLVVVTAAAGRRATVYRMVWPDEHPVGVPARDGTAAGPVPLTTARGPADDARGPAGTTSSVLTSVQPPSIHTRNAQNAHPDAQTEQPDRFDEFWQTATVKKDKGRARKAYEKALTLTDTHTLHTAWETANRAWSQWVIDDPDSRRYIPMPTTWLNGERWDDDPPDPNQQTRSRNEPASKYAAFANEIEQLEGTRHGPAGNRPAIDARQRSRPDAAASEQRRPESAYRHLA